MCACIQGLAVGITAEGVCRGSALWNARFLAQLYCKAAVTLRATACTLCLACKLALLGGTAR